MTTASSPAAPRVRAPGGRSRLAGLASTRLAPEAVLALLLLVGGVLLAIKVNTRVTYVILDETQIKASAVHYTSGLPHSLIYDYYARATARLYPLLITPIVANFSGDVAVRIIRSLNIAIFALAAIPVYLMARDLIASRWRVVAVAALSVALPWIVLTSALYTESLAYALTVSSVYAMTRVLRAPSWRRDALAVGLMVLATFTRTQLVSLFLAYAVVIVIAVGGPVWRARTFTHVELLAIARRQLLRIPFTVALVLAGIAFAIYEFHHGAFGFRLNHLLGGYAASTAARTTFPSDMFVSFLVELLALTIGLGAVPAVVGLSWYPRSWSRHAQPAARAFALVSALAMGFLFVTTLYAQGAYLEGSTEERYYFYAAPFLLIAAFAAWDRREVDRRRTIWVGAVIAAVAATVVLPRAFDQESTFFAPAITSTHYAVDQALVGLTNLFGTAGISERDLLALVILALVFGVAAAHRWMPRRGVGVLVLVGALLQLGAVGLTLAATTGGVPNVLGRTGGVTFKELGFGDRASHEKPITWFDNEIRDSEPQAWFVQRDAQFYNTFVAQRTFIAPLGITPDTYPLSGLPSGPMTVTPATGMFTVAGLPDPVGYAIETTESPFFQVAGQRVYASPYFRLEAIRTQAPLQLRWLAAGMDVTGALQDKQPATLDAWNDESVVLHIAPLAGPTNKIHIKLGPYSTTTASTGDLQIKLPCGHVTGALMPIDQPIRFSGVTVNPYPPGHC